MLRILGAVVAMLLVWVGISLGRAFMTPTSNMWYSPTGNPTQPEPHKLVAFNQPADRYFSANSRDFFAVHLRPSPAAK